MTSFPLSITFSYRGKLSSPPIDIPREVTSDELVSLARQQFDIIADDDDILLKLLYKGKVIAQSNNNNDDGVISPFLAANGNNVKFKSPLKIIVMGTQLRSIDKLNSQKSDPLMRGFDHEQSQKQQSDSNVYWGRHSITPHRQYKFIQLQECTDASFGTRPNSTTPHAFSARRLLHRLSADPGLTAILTSRQLVVNTLAEMDPIDDVLMQKQQARGGGCLLGYNTNHGYRIDIKLRSDDITTFRPYRELCSTLIHELSHNWCGEHDVLFWTNYAQMRVEYLWTHYLLGGELVDGKRTADLAGVMDMIWDNSTTTTTTTSTTSNESHSRRQRMEYITNAVLNETSREMIQHRIPVRVIVSAVTEFGKDLLEETKDYNSIGGGEGQKLGGGSNNEDGDVVSMKELALAAAERRRKGNGDEENGDK